jgi:hypothetical protein
MVVNVDERSTWYEGVTYLRQDEAADLPAVVLAASFRTLDKSKPFTCRTTEISPVDPRSRLPVSHEEFLRQYGNSIRFATYADIQGTWDEESLLLSWTTDTGMSGTARLAKSQATNRSSLVAETKTWNEYKELVAGLEEHRYLFRGQNMPWRLRTSFHRTGRAYLRRFTTVDISALHRSLSARTRHIFNLSNADENGAFYNLIQHHGYPTPLLDWTYSPYVAAFFAYRETSNEKAAPVVSADDRVRVLILDRIRWDSDFSPILMADPAVQHFSIAEFIAIENERLIPQQAVSSVTNIDDIETFIQSKESEAGYYLRAIDLPRSERKRVMRELSTMGITAGSLFPGIDGACEELKERYFD